MCVCVCVCVCVCSNIHSRIDVLFSLLYSIGIYVRRCNRNLIALKDTLRKQMFDCYDPGYAAMVGDVVSVVVSSFRLKTSRTLLMKL